MHIRLYGFYPGRRINATGEVADTAFALSAIGAGDHMSATIRFGFDDTGVKLDLPNDITEGDLPTYIRAALATLYREERAA